MAGVKGRSGGARSGAGRKPKEPDMSGIVDAKVFLEQVVAGVIDASPAQLKAAQALLPFQHAKKGDAAIKKEEADAKQRAASSGRFGRRDAPKLAAVGGMKV